MRTEYSFGYGFGTCKEVLERCIKVDETHPYIADYCSTFGFMKWHSECKAKGIKPIYGVILPVSNEESNKRYIYDEWTFIARNENGLKELNTAVEDAYRNYKYRPYLTYLEAIMVNDCIKITGHRSLIKDLALAISEYGKVPRNLYFEISPIVSRDYCEQMICQVGLEPFAIQHQRYPSIELRGLYEIASGKNREFRSFPLHIMDEYEWEYYVQNKFGKDIMQASLHNKTLELTIVGDVRLQTASFIENNESNLDLEKICLHKLHDIGLYNKKYLERLSKEFTVLQSKGFLIYFEIVYDLVKKLKKDRIIVGPGRGSACGSLICFLLEITNIDPIKYGLLFERFIDETRPDLPDIDIDFPDNKRKRALEYLSNKYGEKYVASLSTVTKYGPLMACNDTDRETGSNSNKGSDINERIMASKLIGRIRHKSRHPAAIVLSNLDLRRIAPIDPKTNCLLMEMDDAEKSGLLKIDALGLRQLKVFSDLRKKLPNVLSLEQIIDTGMIDDMVFHIFNKGLLSTIFQFSGRTVRNLTKRINVENFSDLVALTSLARPGPLASGFAKEWIERRNNNSYLNWKSEILSEVLSETNGVIIYQEQIMRLCRNLGEFSWKEVAEIRRKIGKSKGEESLEPYLKQWSTGCISNGVNLNEAVSLWHQIIKFGKYGFNKSHAVAYSAISYYCAFLRAYYPLEYCTSYLDNEPDKKKQKDILMELKKCGVKFIPNDIEKAGLKWKYLYNHRGANQIIAPLTNIKGIGKVKAKQIINDRENKIDHKSGIIKIMQRNQLDIDSVKLISDEIKEVCPDLTKLHIYSKPITIRDFTQMDGNEKKLLVGKVSHISEKDMNEPDKIQKRGFRINNRFPKYISFQLNDDTEMVWCRISATNINQHKSFLNTIKKTTYIAIETKKWQPEGQSDSFSLAIVSRFRKIG